ncbi:MAG: phosphonate C-P lyase system protein PhnG [Alphaproteobacteria bacterium]|nr:phosphonate C-P lyase system protein PhnG [Alphaproteobacteria bacterium]
MPNDAPRHASPPEHAASRQRLMRCCAIATDAELADAVASLGPLPRITDVRRPETGLVMLRGRIGGDGAPFNVGEATVTRAVVKLETGEIGHAYLLGRSGERARLAATIDALGQTGANRERIDEAFIKPVTARLAAERQTRKAETAATRVNFFTLARGED